MAAAAAEAPGGTAPDAVSEPWASFTWRSGTDLLDLAETAEVRPGRRLSVLRRAPAAPGRPTLLFVHGSAASMTQFLPLIAALVERRGFGVVAYDWLGCGRSEKPESWCAYGRDELFEDVAAVWAQYCKVGGRADDESGRRYIVAHSFGAHLALALALRLQEEATAASEAPPVAGLVLLSAAAQFPEGHPIFRLPVSILKYMQPLLTRTFVSSALAPGADPELVAQQEEACDKNPMFMCKAYYRQMRNLATDELASARAPALVLRGEHDGLIPLEGSQALADLLPGADRLVVVPGTSHNLMLERPDEVAMLVAQFVAAAEETRPPT